MQYCFFRRLRSRKRQCSEKRVGSTVTRLVVEKLMYSLHSAHGSMHVTEVDSIPPRLQIGSSCPCIDQLTSRKHQCVVALFIKSNCHDAFPGCPRVSPTYFRRSRAASRCTPSATRTRPPRGHRRRGRSRSPTATQESTAWKMKKRTLLPR